MSIQLGELGHVNATLNVGIANILMCCQQESSTPLVIYFWGCMRASRLTSRPLQGQHTDRGSGTPPALMQFLDSTQEC